MSRSTFSGISSGRDGWRNTQRDELFCGCERDEHPTFPFVIEAAR